MVVLVHEHALFSQKSSSFDGQGAGRLPVGLALWYEYAIGLRYPWSV